MASAFAPITAGAAAIVVLTACQGLPLAGRQTPTATPTSASAPATPAWTTLPTVSAPAVPASPQQGPPAPAGASLAASFSADAPRVSDRVGIAVAAVSGGDPVLLGEWRSGVAWSTSKVPLSIAVLRTPAAAQSQPTIRQALVYSDNDSAERLWQSLGQPSTAAGKVDQVLADYGSPATRTQSRVVRSGYTAFGQTEWSLGDQARFAAQVACRAEAQPVRELLGQISADQRWGLGRWPGARFKGGWGPGTDGSYLVRQLGVVEGPRGLTAVAIATESAGSLEQGSQTLSELTRWLQQHQDQLPAGRC